MSKIKISMCAECKGKGTKLTFASNGVEVDARVCVECKGTGKIISSFRGSRRTGQFCPISRRT